MKPVKKDIKEIAELLDCGEICFYNKLTGTIEHHPDPNSDFFEQDMWNETIDKIESEFSNYLRFEKMNSRMAFSVMENFTNSLNDQEFQNTLIKLFAQPQPFRNFKWIIDNSDYRQQWFDFKAQAYIEWVNEQISEE
jgi:hypothetical protein